MTAPGLLAAVSRILTAAPGETIGIAVSGGGDSLALLVLAHRWARAGGRRVAAITIDHGLRPESAAEAMAVAEFCAARGISHAIRRWEGAAPGPNLQDRARTARRALIVHWAMTEGITAVALGHTRDDQAETFLLRLARGSGVDGLAAMVPAALGGGTLWLRPLLDVSRQTLRSFLEAEGVAWADDPSNDDLHFDRVRARAALPVLAGLGLGPERLAKTAAAMARARAALEAVTADLAVRAVRPQPAGDVLLDPAELRDAPEELQLRLLAGTLAWVAGARYRPRLAILAAAADAVCGGRVGHGLTLHGCVLRSGKQGHVAVRREPARVAPTVPLSSGHWDNRWAITLPAGVTFADGIGLGALGARGLAAAGDWRALGLPREALLTTPALWLGDHLVAAPLANVGPVVRAMRIAPLTPPWAVTDMSLLR